MTNWRGRRGRRHHLALTARAKATRATMVGTRVATQRCDANLKKPIVVRIESATRLHEVGIASNRGSECRGEYVPGFVHTPVTPWEFVAPEVASLTAKRAGYHGVADDWGEVVTRVAVGNLRDHSLTKD